MNKKMYLWVVIGLVVVIAIIYLLVSATGSGNSTTQTPGGSVAKPAGGSNQLIVPTGGTTAETPAAEPEVKISEEIFFEANGSTFTPKVITVNNGEKAFITFSATDDKEHMLTSDDPKLPLLVIFSKKEGKKSISFDSPSTGSYTFYVDDKANTGTFTVR